MPDILMEDKHITGKTFTCERKVIHIPSDNGLTNTLAIQNYIWSRVGGTGTGNTRAHEVVYFRYLQEPAEKPNYFVRSIGAGNNVTRWNGTSYINSSIGSAYTGYLVEGDVEACIFRTTVDPLS